MYRVTLFFFLTTLTPFSSASPDTILNVVGAAYPKAVTHRIAMETIVEGASCTATAIGPHALLTASHCVLGTGRIYLDNAKDASLIDHIVYDENEHAVIYLKSVVFVNLAPVQQRAPESGEHIQFAGFQGGAKKAMQREGEFVSAEPFNDDEDVYVFDLPTYPGDSGSGVMADDGSVITVITFGSKGRAQAGCFRLKFTDEQLADAQRWS